MKIAIKRAYAEAAPEDGVRVLVDRVWPRGLSRDRLKLDAWSKELAPSTGLRKWFDHDPAKWDEFCRRYEAELKDSAAALDTLRDQIGTPTKLTLVYSAKDEEHNQAIVLRDYLKCRL